MKLSDNKLTGMLLSAKGRTQKTLITTMPMIEVSAYFSLTKLLPELKWVADAAVNSTNSNKVQAIQAELEKVAIDNVVSAPLSLTFAITGKPSFQKASSSLSTLSYSPSNTCIVGNVLGLVAICKILGIKTFLFSSRLSVKEANQKSELRQRLAMESVEIRVIFDDEQGLDEKHVVELFKKSQVLDSALSLPHLDEGQNLLPDDQFPLRPFIEQLVKETNIESYGGVSFDSKHVKVSERCITTQYVLFKLIVGAVAGVGTQEYSKMSKDVTLPNGTSLTSVLSDGYASKISTFLKAWLELQAEAFINSRSGYQLSPQVWQALGLTIHRLVSDEASLNDLQAAGKALGSLDYSKDAKHWDSCSVMELDAKGRIYKNAASSTRLFRIGLCEYFVEVVEAMNNKEKNSR
ncbi:hypothetical protein AB9R80_000480 [Vibrio cyclitrophicus]